MTLLWIIHVLFCACIFPSQTWRRTFSPGILQITPNDGQQIADFLAVFQFQEKATGLALPDLMELHFVELPKFKAKPRGLQTRLEKWLHMIRSAEMYENAKSLPDELRTDEIFVRVLEELEHVNADEKMRAILEQRDKEKRTRLPDINATLKKRPR